VWTWTFVIAGGLILLGACSKGWGLFAFIAAFLLGGVVASGVSYATSRPNRRDEAFLERIQRDLMAQPETRLESERYEAVGEVENEAEPRPAQREYGALVAQPFDGPHGRFEPGDHLRVHMVRDEEDSPLHGDVTGRYLGTQLVNGENHLVLEIVATGQDSYRTIIPVADADRLTRTATET
jgi:hypothetical protein